MEDDSRTGVKKSLRWFLIKRFLIIVFFIFVSEEIIGILFGKLAPKVSELLASWQISISGGGHPVSLTFHMLLYSLASLLPSTVAGYVQGIISNWMGDSMRIAVTSPLFTGRWGVFLRIIVIAILLIVLFISLLPWILGAFYYYWMVTKKVNELMEEEKAQQLANDRERNLLLSDIAHDIKTPLTTLCGYSKALADGMVKGEKRQEYLDAIYVKSQRMNELITLLFDYVKMDSSGFELQKTETDLGELLRECIAALYADFEDKEMSLQIDIPDGVFLYQADRVQMARAITNLLTNAVRYGKEGGKVWVQLEDYTITVADDGMEIEEEFARHIFEPFSRADKARSTSGGSGLGLSIAYKIVQMHGGELRLKCGYGQGYTKAFQICFFVD